MAMYDALDVLARCAALNLVLEARGDAIAIIGPRPAREAVAEEVRARKLDLLCLLPPAAPTGCAGCSGPQVRRRAIDGSLWCRRCDWRRYVLDLAFAAGYPRLPLRPTMLITVPPGPGAWSEFVRRVASGTLYVALRKLRAQTAELDRPIAPSISPLNPWSG
jgi:hypothetical protein